jgi:U3 small nucleolar RNA-associated protein 19
MPGAVADAALKRKRKGGLQAAKKRPRSNSNESSSSDGEDEQSKILLLENGILESRKNYNNITTLIEISRKQDDSVETAVVAAVSLCRVFIRLLASGNLSKKKDASEKDKTIMRWLRERLGEYKGSLLPLLKRDEAALTALTLSMRILKAEAEHLHSGAEYTFPTAFFAEIVSALVQPEVDDNVREEFMEKFVNEHDDIRFYTFKSVR